MAEPVDLPALPAGRQAAKAGALKLHAMYSVYAIKSQKKNYIYVGMTGNIDRRLKQHSSGKERTTKPYAPFDLIYIENFDNRSAARSKEKYLKSGIGKEFLRSLL